MILIRKNNSIFWLAALLASAAWWMPSTPLKVWVSLVSIFLVALGALIAFRPPAGAADPKHKFRLPLAVLLIAGTALLSVLAC